MYLAVIVLPLLASVASGFFGRKIGVSGAQLVTNICVIVATIFSIIMFIEVTFHEGSLYILLCRWLELGSMNILWAFSFDFLTVSMLIPVLIISSLVHLYSIGYMRGDPHNQRFFSYLSLFTFMMVILVTSNNFLLMFVGWEGVGICSYLLVNFWFTRIAANQSSISALLTNRVGDCFLTIGMFILLLSYGNIDYTTVFSVAPYIGEEMIGFASVCLIIGAMAKSSQIGLHVWLPLAMEGPTPVSALIHAATMVTAGVYLLIRTSPILEYSGTALLACLWIGSVTTVFSSMVGLFQQDIKKVIAYSTMSQLGMMVIAIGLSCYNLALFHLVNHAFYKGLLFLAAGAVIHAVTDNQDFRKYGGLILLLPLTYTVMLIASLSLVAFPFMAGFYSKDFILESCFSQFTYPSITVYFTAVIGAMFTTLYSVKVLYLTFIGRPLAPSATYNKAHESDMFMSLPLVVLAIFSIYFGFLTKDIFIGLGSHAFTDNSIFIHPLHEIYISCEFAVSSFFKLLPFFITIAALVISIMIFEAVPSIIITIKYTRIVYHIFAYLNLKFLIESIYNRFVTYFILIIGGRTTKVLDKGLVEMIGPYGLEIFIKSLSAKLNMLNTYVVTTYALYILTGFIFFVCLPYYYKNAFILFMLVCIVISFAYYLSTQYNNNKHDYTIHNIKQLQQSNEISIAQSSFDFTHPALVTGAEITTIMSYLIIGITMWIRARNLYPTPTLANLDPSVENSAMASKTGPAMPTEGSSPILSILENLDLRLIADTAADIGAALSADMGAALGTAGAALGTAGAAAAAAAVQTMITGLDSMLQINGQPDTTEPVLPVYWQTNWLPNLITTWQNANFDFTTRYNEVLVPNWQSLAHNFSETYINYFPYPRSVNFTCPNLNNIGSFINCGIYVFINHPMIAPLLNIPFGELIYLLIVFISEYYMLKLLLVNRYCRILERTSVFNLGKICPGIFTRRLDLGGVTAFDTNNHVNARIFRGHQRIIMNPGPNRWGPRRLSVNDQYLFSFAFFIFFRIYVRVGSYVEIRENEGPIERLGDTTFHILNPIPESWRPWLFDSLSFNIGSTVRLPNIPTPGNIQWQRMTDNWDVWDQTDILAEPSSWLDILALYFLHTDFLL